MGTHDVSKPCSLSQGLVQYRGMLFGFIYSLVRDVVAAEEIFQEVAVIALEKERKGDEVIREPAKWLKVVIRRLILAGYRTRQGRFINVDSEYLEQVTEGFETEATTDPQRVRLAALGDCLAAMTASHRDVLARRYVEGASYDDIGREVHRSPGALRVLVHRLQRQLADCVEQRLAEESGSHDA